MREEQAQKRRAGQQIDFHSKTLELRSSYAGHPIFLSAKICCGPISARVAE